MLKFIVMLKLLFAVNEILLPPPSPKQYDLSYEFISVQGNNNLYIEESPHVLHSLLVPQSHHLSLGCPRLQFCVSSCCADEPQITQQIMKLLVKQTVLCQRLSSLLLLIMRYKDRNMIIIMSNLYKV